MKKILTVILLAAVLTGCTVAVAYGATADEEQIKQLATSHDKVLACECVIHKRACVIAVKTEKFTTKSEYDEYVEGLKEQITSKFEVDYVFVSRSPKMMRELVELNKLDENERVEAIEELIAKQLQRHGHKIPPKML